MEIILTLKNGSVTVETTVEDIRINKKLSDLIDVEKKYNNFTWEFQLVGTKELNEFMKYSYQINSTMSFNPNKSLEGDITIDRSGVLINGSVRLISTNINDNGDVIYNVQLQGFIRDLFSILEDFKLTSLDFSEYNHSRTIDHIKENIEGYVYKNGSLIKDDEFNREGYVYPHIIYNSLDDANSHLYLNNMFPGIYFKTIVRKIEETLDLNLGDFLKSDLFNNVIIPYTGDNIKKTEEQIDEQSTRIGTSNTYDLTGWRTHGSKWWKNSLYGKQTGPNRPYQFIDGLSLDDESSNVLNNGNDYEFQDKLNSWTGDRYVTRVPGYYDINFDGKLRCQFKEAFDSTIQYNGGGSLEYYYNLKINGKIVDSSYNPITGGGTLFITPPSGTHTSPWTLPTTFTFNVSQNNVFLEEFDVVTLDYGFRFSGATKWAGNEELIEARLLLDRSESTGGGSDYSTFEVTPSDNNSYGGEEFRLSSILDDSLTVADFIRDLIKMFNLVIIPKEKGSFDILPENQYFKTKAKETKDLTYHIDNYSEVNILPMNESNYKQYVLKLQGDNDMYNEDFENSANQVYGRKRLNLENDFTNETKTISPSNFATSIISDEFTGDRPSVYFLKEDLSEFKGKMRLLKTKTIQSSDWEIWRAPDSKTKVDLTSYIYAGTWTDPYDADFNFNFSTPEKIYHSSQNIPSNNLYTDFWREKLLNIADPDARLITISNAKMSYLDYINFDFRDVYTIDGREVRIVSLGNYNPNLERLSIECYTITKDFNYTEKQRIIKQGTPNEKKITKPNTKGLINENQFDKPYTLPEKISRLRTNLNSNRNTKTISNSNRSIIKDSSSNVVLNANKVNVMDRVSNAIGSNENRTINKNGIYIGGQKIEEGLKSLKWDSTYVINGNDNLWKTNNTDVLSGGEDSVRNRGGIRHDRVILNGNGSSLFGQSSEGIM